MRVDGELREIEKGTQLDRYQIHDVEVVVDRVVVKGNARSRVAQSVELAFGAWSGMGSPRADRVRWAGTGGWGELREVIGEGRRPSGTA